MNILYAKAVLYAYPCLGSVATQIDELVEKKALSSMNDFSPCIEQCEKIISFTNQKCMLLELKSEVKEILSKFTDEERELLDYKYFGRKRKVSEDFNAATRKYFRNQIKVAKKFASLLEKRGYGDAVLEEKYFSTDFFKALYRKVIEHEQKSYKNKKKSEKFNATNKPESELSREGVTEQKTEQKTA